MNAGGNMITQWETFCAQAGLKGDVAGAFQQLAAAYEKPLRQYHNLNHIAACLRELDSVRPQCEDPSAVEAAIWLHDVIYDAKRSDNEDRSAEMAAEMLHNLSASANFITTVRELILDTRHKAPPQTHDGQLLVDIDLSIMGRPANEFDAYEAAIRAEYAHVSEADFRAGRAAVLERFLQRPVILATAAFHEKYERPARENLARSLSRLQTTPATS